MTQPMNVGIRFGRPNNVVTLEPPQVEVRIDEAPEPRLRLDRLETAMGAAPRAWFSVGFGRNPQTDEDLRLEDIAARIRPGVSISAVLLRGGVLPGAERGDLVLFAGRIGRIEMALDADGETLQIEAEDTAAEILRRRLGGQRVWGSGSGTERMEGLDFIFNPDGRPNAATQPYDPGEGDPYTVFAPTSPGSAAAWTLDKAVAYLLAEHGISDAVAIPSPTEVQQAVGAVTIRDVNLEGRSLGEALDALLELVGGRALLATEAQSDGVSRRLELWFANRAAGGWLSHQRVGKPFDTDATQLSALSARMEFDAAPRRYVACGDRKLYEATFDLVAGWNDALASYNPETFSPSQNPDFDVVRDVFRKWVLNEAGEYSASPYGRPPAPDFLTLFEESPYVRRHRRFLPCLSTDALGRSRGVYVEVSLDGGASWQRMNMAARVLAEECGIYLTDDPLPPSYLAAAMRGEVRVRVTATIESDSRLQAERTAEGTQDLPGRTRYFSVAAGYRFRRVAPTSRFSGHSQADTVDDTARLQELVDAAYEADRRSPVPSRIQIPYLALGHRVGERLLGIRGRRLDLARQHDGYESAPVVRRIRYDFAPVPQTELELE